METVVEVERNDGENGVEKSSSSLSSPKSIADPVVYKLVRVEGDGRFVPATEEEVMEVEDFLVDDKTEIHDAAEVENTVEFIVSDQNAPGKLQLEGSEGLSGVDNGEAGAEKLTSQVEESYGLVVVDESSAFMIAERRVFYKVDKFTTVDKNPKPDIPMQEKEIVPTLEPNINESCSSVSRNIEQLSKPPDGQPGSGSSNSSVCNNSKPDFSKLKGEICMDNLSIRELHELFNATFGRETTVKDKLWLKRRIAMGLTNSCDIPTTSFTIKDNRLVSIKNEENDKDSNSTFHEGSPIETINAISGNSPTTHGSQMEHNPIASGQMEDHQTVSGKRSNDSVEYLDNEDLNAEQRAAKRVRKPTKRYIEELSENEPRDYSQKVQHSAKNIGLGQSSPKFSIRPVKSVSLNERIMLTRLDSLGGSGVQIPCVSRVRRSRPRKNIKALMKFHPSSMGMAAEVVKKALAVPGSQLNSEFSDKVSKSRSASEPTEPPLTSEADRDKKCSAIVAVNLGKSLGLKRTDSSEDNSDDGIATVPTPKGGMRRKHHRAWTLVEVMKLVEGVSRCGAGRWSEIKRLAFASYSYRTSVDLKDKWRNLLKASLAQSPPDEGMNSRKNATSIPIPAPILLRVRELAEMQSQAAPNVGSNSVGGRSLNEARSGYL